MMAPAMIATGSPPDLVASRTTEYRYNRSASRFESNVKQETSHGFLIAASRSPRCCATRDNG